MQLPSLEGLHHLLSCVIPLLCQKHLWHLTAVPQFQFMVLCAGLSNHQVIHTFCASVLQVVAQVTIVFCYNTTTKRSATNVTKAFHPADLLPQVLLIETA